MPGPRGRVGGRDQARAKPNKLRSHLYQVQGGAASADCKHNRYSEHHCLPQQAVQACAQSTERGTSPWVRSPRDHQDC